MINAPLVILPGLMCNAAMFAPTLAAFPGALAINDFYAPADRLPAMATHALAQLPDRFALLGHSMGARIALEVCRQAPERVAALCLADTGAHLPPPGEQAKRYALRDLGRREGFAALIDAWLPPMLGAKADPVLAASLRAMCLTAGQTRFEAQTEALLHRPATDDLLPIIACPTLVIVGEEDAWSPVEQHRALADAIPGAKLVVVPGAGHMLPAEAPQAFNAALAAWLEQS